MKPATVVRLERVPHERPWGGDGIAAFELHAEAEKPIGEWWVRAPRVPLLVKLLDAREDLSIQLHPDDANARALNLGQSGKTEAWYVLAAKPGARLLIGLRKGVSVAAFLDAARAGVGVAELLVEVKPERGQILFIAPGTIHAVGAGCTLLEVQQDCDVTLRVFDWNRVPKRELHLDSARLVLERIAGAASGIAPCVLRGQSLTCAYFDLEVTHSRLETRVQLDRDEIWFLAAGRAELVGAGDAVTLAPGEFVCVAPGSLLVRPTDAAELVRMSAPRPAAPA